MSILGISLLLLQVQQGTVSGSVTKPGGIDPLPGATVILNPSNASQTSRIRSTISEDDGRFSIPDIEPGDYRLQAQSAQYGSTSFGQRKPGGPGAILTIPAGQRLSDLKLSMVPTGTIAGRITGRSGEPIAYASVQSLRFAYQEGRRILTVAQTTTTDDRGEYRLFWLTGGKYVVVASPRAGTISPAAISPPSRPGDRRTTEDLLLLRASVIPTDGTSLVKRILEDGSIQEEAWMPTYYPATTDRSQASSVEVTAGSTVPGINITLGPSPVQKIRGRVTGFTGLATVSLIPGPQASTIRLINKGASTIDGSFEFFGVLPGAYYLAARDGTGLHSKPLPVLVGDRDVEGLALALEPGLTLRARITIEGVPEGSTAIIAGLTATLITSLGVPATLLSFNLENVQVTDGNLMVFSNVPSGEYQMQINQGVFRDNEKGLSIKSIHQGRDDALESVRVSSDSPNVLDVVLTTETGSVEGVAIGRAGDPAANITVVLVPANARKRTALYQTLVTSSGGRFRFQGIPPGDYKVFAWDDIEPGAWQDADFMRPYESRGRSVRVSENGKEELQLNVIYNP